MQQSWRQDADKLTFITCFPVEDHFCLKPSTTPPTSGSGSCPFRPITKADDSPERMIGDINLFLRVDDGEEGISEPLIVGEIELMVAERQNQRQGFGKASLLVFLRYVVDHEGEIIREFFERGEGHDTTTATITEQLRSSPRLSCLSVKVGKGNARSLALFESVAFEKVSEEPNFFGEYELRRKDLTRQEIDEELLRAGVEGYTEVPFRLDE